MPALASPIGGWQTWLRFWERKIFYVFSYFLRSTALLNRTNLGKEIIVN
ncbi:MAG: hypothetical protein UW89_C0013G0001 [Parcubacteria group bacterium GW2011_GWB1_45_10]|nr:MAG: hypothetical protein UW89_C0013G0001 [Parcubacteria group bacterium GW2011_GWB1_45_10]